jgi:hypothetical protein
MADSNLFSFQGYVFLAERSAAGKPLKPQWVGDATLTISLESETADHYESFTGRRTLYGQIITRQNANATLTLYEANPTCLALGLYGNTADISSASITDETFPAGLADGDIVTLDGAYPENLIITDSTSGTPVTLTEGQHYDIYPAGSNLVRLLDISSLTQPLHAAYTASACQRTTIFTQTPPERWLIMDGVNTITNQRLRVELYRVRFNPANELNLHNEEFGSFELTGAALVDAALINDPALGGFGRLIFKDAA